MESYETYDQDRNPRTEMIRAINDTGLVHCLLKTAELHGHFCPGSALGVMASVWGLRQLGNGIMHSDGMEDLMAVVEINACFADGVQVVSGCTLGNNALVYRDLGRLAVTFAVRGKPEGIRIRVRPDFRDRIGKLVPEFYPLMEKVVAAREGDPETLEAFKRRGREAAFALLRQPFEEILVSRGVTPELPEYAPITESAVCPGCGEQVMATKVMPDGEHEGFCRMCAGSEYRQVEGRGIEDRRQA